jgi:hypothetical protein
LELELLLHDHLLHPCCCANYSQPKKSIKNNIGSVIDTLIDSINLLAQLDSGHVKNTSTRASSAGCYIYSWAHGRGNKKQTRSEGKKIGREFRGEGTGGSGEDAVNKST